MKVLSFLSVIGLTFLFGANAVAVTPRFLEADKLLAGDGASEDFFGYSVGFEGNTAVFGAWGDDDNGPFSGAAHPITTLKQGDLVSSAHQVVGRDQTIDASTDDSDVL